MIRFFSPLRHCSWKCSRRDAPPPALDVLPSKSVMKIASTECPLTRHVTESISFLNEAHIVMYVFSCSFITGNEHQWQTRRKPCCHMLSAICSRLKSQFTVYVWNCFWEKHNFTWQITLQFCTEWAANIIVTDNLNFLFKKNENLTPVKIDITSSSGIKLRMTDYISILNCISRILVWTVLIPIGPIPISCLWS